MRTHFQKARRDRFSKGCRCAAGALLGAIMLAGPCMGARKPSRALKNPVELNLVMDAPTPTVTVKTDRGPLTLLVDTGSTVTSLAKGGPLRITFDDGSVVDLYAQTQKDCRSDFGLAQQRSTFRLDGVLGGTFFEHFRRMTVDYQRGKIVLEP